MAHLGTDWRLVDDVVTAWFDASSLSEGAALARRVVAMSAGAAVDLRATGLRVRLDPDDQPQARAEAVSDAARGLGLAADPDVLQQVDVVLESPDPERARSFWQGVLDHEPTADGGLVDPLRRDPGLRFRGSDEPRPLRNRLHLDVVRPAAVVARVSPGEASGPYGVRHADPDGNEVDLVPGDPLGEGDRTADWQAVFSAIACYRTTSVAQQGDLVAAAAALADAAGFPLLVDLRPGLVVLDSGKDQAEADAHGLEVDVVDLAARLQAAARELGAVPEPGLARFVQLFLDAADVTAVRAFWAAVLGYVEDRRDGVTDLHDPRRLGPVVVLQELDASDGERRRQRNRSHVELAVPADRAEARVAVALAAGGRLLDQSPGRWRVADPEGNELVVVGGP